MNTYELAHEFYEARLHSDNGIPNQNALTEERDTNARIVSHTDPGAILLDVIIIIIISILEPCFPLPRVGLFDKSFSKASSPLRTILRVSRIHT